MPTESNTPNQKKEQSASDSKNDEAPATTRFGVASLICGLASLILQPIVIPLAIAAIILFFVQRWKGANTTISILGLSAGILSLIIIPLIIFGLQSYTTTQEYTTIQIPDKCIFNSEIGICNSVITKDNTVQITLTNNIGQQLQLTKMTVLPGKNAVPQTCNPTVTTVGNVWTPGSAKTFALSGCDLSTSTRLQYIVQLSYSAMNGTSQRIIEGDVVINK